MSDPSWDAYFIPGTHAMRNKFTRGGRFPNGIPSMVVVGALEEHWARLRLMELTRSPLLGRFDYDHMKAIHRHIFQDTFVWAGQERSAPTGGPMIKFGPDVSAFPKFDPRDYSVPHEYTSAGRELTEAATHEYALLKEADYLRGLALGDFVDNLALRWVSLNVVHSFREGNTRSQLVFFSELAHHAGYHLDARAFLPPSREDRLAGVTNPVRERFVAARYYFQDYHDHTPMADTLADVITPLTEDQRRARPIVPIEQR
ncbi:Fic/DOC family protein [Actinomyces bouchesdurhonensis]|uniref:Fic/DOC family protein n=1 Tax=Actinomyces bouchesdurhonensis TaxID=1852361 RepID=UPI0023F4F043|nr:Fic family protein [Actinomyces bouchesdurhonensis]